MTDSHLVVARPDAAREPEGAALLDPASPGDGQTASQRELYELDANAEEPEADGFRSGRTTKAGGGPIIAADGVHPPACSTAPNG
jgi:hypothetical protein